LEFDLAVWVPSYALPIVKLACTLLQGKDWLSRQAGPWHLARKVPGLQAYTGDL